MKENYTDIIVVLDESGSMQVVANDTMGGFNQFLKDQKEAEGVATFTLIKFNTEYSIVHNGVNIQEVPELDSKTYKPGGGTALFDAIARGIYETGVRLSALSEDERPSKVICVILTDGEENSSREYTDVAVIKDMITHQQEKYSWEFVFLGANQDAFSTAGNLGINAGATLNYAQSSVGTQAVFGSISKGMSKRRGGDLKSSYFDEQDRKTQEDLGA